MFSLANLSLNNANNQPYLTFDGTLKFEDNCIYFIIGRSGVGKTSIIDFLSSPFTDTPVKNGVISFPAQFENMRIINSSARQSRQYADFARKRFAYIPQKTDSFHPAIPVRQQLMEYYRMASGKKKISDADFSALLSKFSPYAGWDKVTLSETNKDAVLISDNKSYISEDGGKVYPIIDKTDVEKTFEDEFSTGQLQRLLILLGLLRFSASASPVLLADEFLVNFTYKEANDVLSGILCFFRESQKSGKTAIFVLHDLSFDCLKSLDEHSNVRLIAISKGEGVSITADEITLNAFFNSAWKNERERAVFAPFLASYEDKALHENNLHLEKPSSEIVTRIAFEDSRPYGSVYHNVSLDIRRGRFIVLTGFSGCGKSTLANQMITECFPGSRKSVRYFPSRMSSFLSLDSSVSVSEDLLTIFRYYHGTRSLNECRAAIKRSLVSVRLYDEHEITDAALDEFFSKKIYDLSGGQQQRYWFLRILFGIDSAAQESKPQILVLDESIASLDCLTKNEIISYLVREVFGKHGLTVFLISHDLRDINVIYKTLEQAAGERISEYFEHYEMFNKGLYRVKTPFPEYTKNLLTGKCSEYLSCEGILRLKFNAAKCDGRLT